MKQFAAFLTLAVLALSFFLYPAPDAPDTAPNIGELVTTAQPSGIGEFSDPVGIGVYETTKEVQAYLFHTDQSGKRVYKPSAVIPSGTLVKLGACLSDGYAQIEYQVEDNYWRVEYVKCR